MGFFDWLFRRRPVPTPTPTPPDQDVVGRLLQLHNSVRTKQLVINPKLATAAQKHAEWMNAKQRMSHTGAGGSSPFDRMKQEGYNYSYAGENVAYGYTTPDSVFNGWMNSTGHKRNILNSDFREVGFGISGTYWCADFGSPLDVNNAIFHQTKLPGGLSVH